MRFKGDTLKRIIALALLITLLAAGSARADHSVVLPYPEELTVNVITEAWNTVHFGKVEVDLPVTCNEAVNAKLRGVMRGIFKQSVAAAMPENRVDLRSTYRVSGTSWVGFLLSGRVIEFGMSEHNSFETQNTTFFCHDISTYDTATGKALTLADVFPAEGKAWTEIADLARATLRSYYPALPHNEAAIDEMCDVGALKQMPFLPCAGRLLITFPMSAVVEGKLQLAHVSLPYPDFRGLMTDEARAQTDNSARPMIALTYDDGPRYQPTQELQRNLDRFGATVTFFCIGISVIRWPDLVRRSMDAGHEIGSHTMEHKYSYQVRANDLEKDRFACIALHEELIGSTPTLFRAPGGSYEKYAQYSIGWPLIQWSSSAGDTGNNTAKALALHVTAHAADGSIILLHDSYMKTAKGAEMYLAEFVERGFMFATVDELMYLHGIVPQPDKVYVDCFGEYVPRY